MSVLGPCPSAFGNECVFSRFARRCAKSRALPHTDRRSRKSRSAKPEIPRRVTGNFRAAWPEDLEVNKCKAHK